MTGAAPGPRQVSPIRQMTRDYRPQLCGAQGSVLIRTAAEKQLAGILEGPGRHDTTLDPRPLLHDPSAFLPPSPGFRHALHHGHPRVSLAACCRPETSLQRLAALRPKSPSAALRLDASGSPEPSVSRVFVAPLIHYSLLISYCLFRFTTCPFFAENASRLGPLDKNSTSTSSASLWKVSASNRVGRQSHDAPNPRTSSGRV